MHPDDVGAILWVPFPKFRLTADVAHRSRELACSTYPHRDIVFGLLLSSNGWLSGSGREDSLAAFGGQYGGSIGSNRFGGRAL
jgi:hypothetical protein